MDAFVRVGVENLDGSRVQLQLWEEARQFIQLRLVEDASAEGEGVACLRSDLHIEHGGAFVERFGEGIEDGLHGTILPSVIACALVWETEG